MVWKPGKEVAMSIASDDTGWLLRRGLFENCVRLSWLGSEREEVET